MRPILALVLVVLSSAACFSQGNEQVGPAASGGYVVSTQQLVRPAGETVEFGARPTDLALSPDGKTVYVKTNSGLVVIDAVSWKIRQQLRFEKGLAGSMHGIAVSSDGSRVYLTTSENALLEAIVASDGAVSWGRSIAVVPVAKGKMGLCGVALLPDEKTACVCISLRNSLGVVDLESGRMMREIAVGIAPYDVKVDVGCGTAYVSNWGGRRPGSGEKTAYSGGTKTLVDERGVASSGTVSIVDLKQCKETAQVETGLHASGLALDDRQGMLYVANANSDTVSVIDTRAGRVVREVNVRPDPSILFGSAPNALALSEDGKALYVANGGNNAVAVVSGDVRGFIPTGWYPGAVATDGRHLYIANVKGVGSRDKQPDKDGWSVRRFLGSAQKVAVPLPIKLKRYTDQVYADARVPQILRAQEKALTGVKPTAVPQRAGEPSLIEHVVYIIKENRTYDQLFGDLPRGNNDPKLVNFGREVTPNHHALAEQFVTLDNFYCNGVVSADGHQWVTEGYVTDYVEKSFGGWPRSYPFAGDDPLAYSSAGFIWDNVMENGLSFRNYGEMGVGAVSGKGATWKSVYDDFVQRTGKYTYSSSINIDNLRRHSCPNYPGWNLKIPDVVRADIFLRELADYEKRGDWPNLVTLFLPNDHTSGTSPGLPTPRAQVADNDLALGRVVEAISKSSFWPKTCIFVIEDDPQAGYDHVDGHRSICLVISPYTKRGEVVSRFYNQTSVLHTMELMLGLPPMNQMDALAPVMRECFTDKQDLASYTALPNRIPLDEMNPAAAQLSGRELELAKQSMALNLDKPDMADEDTLNRIIWHSVKGVDASYPAAFAGPHGKGLKALGLTLTGDDD